MFIYLTIYIFIYQFIYVATYQFIYPFIYLSIEFSFMLMKGVKEEKKKGKESC